MRGVGQCLCFLVWAGRAAANYTCSAAGTIQAPLESATQTLDTLEANLSLVPDCHVYTAKGASPVDCKVDDNATVWFWFTCDPVNKYSGCQNRSWFQKHARVRVKDLTANQEGNFKDLNVTTKLWDGEQYPSWKTTLTQGFEVNHTWFNFADVKITWKDGERPAPGDRIHLHTNIDEISPDEHYNCTGDVDGSGNGASSLVVGTSTTTTTTTTSTTTTCRWAVKPCGQCLATPVEYCPLNPATDTAMLGPISGISFDTSTLDTSRLGRRLSKKGCVAAASLYPEIGVCAAADEKCAHPRHKSMVDTGTNISILLKITNHCINKKDEAKPAWLVGKAVRDLLDASVMFDKYITAENAELESPILLEKWNLTKNESLKLNSSLVDMQLVRYSATVRLKDEKKPVEISAHLRDRSIQIVEEEHETESNDCAKEEGTAWGSTAITVRTTTSTTKTTTSTRTTETETLTTSTSATRTFTSSTSTTGTSTTITTTTRPCACFEMCCEPEPVQGVHMPVVPNVCPEWWQGKMTGNILPSTREKMTQRARQAKNSGFHSNFEEGNLIGRVQQPSASGRNSGFHSNMEEGNLIGRVQRPSASGPHSNFQESSNTLPSNLEESLKTKRSQKSDEECVGCSSVSTAGADADPVGDGPSERVVFRKWSGDNIFRKWSRSMVSETASRHSWFAGGVLLAASAVVLLAVVIRRRCDGPSAHLDRATGEGILDRLVQSEETVHGIL